LSEGDVFNISLASGITIAEKGKRTEILFIPDSYPITVSVIP
jgi:hypothetical protein